MVVLPSVPVIPTSVELLFVVRRHQEEKPRKIGGLGTAAAPAEASPAGHPKAKYLPQIAATCQRLGALATSIAELSVGS